MEELKATFSFRTLVVFGHYYGYKFTIPVMEGLTNPKNWTKQWFFMGGKWEGVRDRCTWSH